MTNSAVPSMPSSPTGVRLVAGLFLLTAGYLIAVGTTMLLAPGTLSMRLGAPLLSGLETAGAYMFLLLGGLGAFVGLGLLWLRNYARRSAAVIALLGIVMLLPGVSTAVVELHLRSLVGHGLGVILRAIVVWYLYQPRVAEAFSHNH